MTRVLVLGAGGMLGHKAFQVFSGEFETIGVARNVHPGLFDLGIFDRDRMITGVDARKEASVARALDEARPDWVLNCVGIIKQRDDASRSRSSIEINALFPHVLADLCEVRGARLIHLSTDCVFSGRRGNYSESDIPDASDLYGRSKFLGEITRDGVLTIRTSMIGRELSGHRSLVEWYLRQSAGPVLGFTHAYFSGLTTIRLAGELARIIAGKLAPSGVYHVSADRISKCDLLGLVHGAYEDSPEIQSDSAFHCDRSLNSTAYREHTGFEPSSWGMMIEEMAADPTPYCEADRLSQ